MSRVELEREVDLGGRWKGEREAWYEKNRAGEKGLS